MFSLVSEVGGLTLVDPRGPHAVLGERAYDAGVHPLRPFGELGYASRQLRGEHQWFFASTDPGDDAIEQHLPVGVARLPSGAGIGEGAFT